MCNKHIVYQITNLLNEMIYIGKHSTNTPDDMKDYWSHNIPLTNARKKYGNKNFKRETLFVFDTEKEAYQKEAEIVTLDFVNRTDTYNLQTGGKGGLQPSEETRKRMSESGKIKFFSEEHRKHISEANSGKNSYWYGKHHTEEENRKNSEAHKGENHYCFGKHLPQKTRDRIGDWHRGKVVSGETRQKIREARELVPEVIEQRREDIKNIPKEWGWKAKLAKKWEIVSSCVVYFVNEYALDLVPNKIEQRLLDVKNIPKEWGWKSELGRWWGITNAFVGYFVQKYAPDLMK